MDEQAPQTHSSNNVRNALVVVVLLVIAVVVVKMLPKGKNETSNNANNSAVVLDFDTCAAAGYPIEQTQPMTCSAPDGRTFTDKQQPGDEVQLDSPVIAQIVTSPLTITGKVDSSWFFEANLPILLEDEDGKVLAQMGYHTDEDWMKPGFINVSTTLKFPAPTTDYGKLVIHNDNPSGDPTKEKTFEVPVRFK